MAWISKGTLVDGLRGRMVSGSWTVWPMVETSEMRGGIAHLFWNEPPKATGSGRALPFDDCCWPGAAPVSLSQRLGIASGRNAALARR